MAEPIWTQGCWIHPIASSSFNDGTYVNVSCGDEPNVISVKRPVASSISLATFSKVAWLSSPNSETPATLTRIAEIGSSPSILSAASIVVNISGGFVKNPYGSSVGFNVFDGLTGLSCGSSTKSAEAGRYVSIGSSLAGSCEISSLLGL